MRFELLDRHGPATARSFAMFRIAFGSYLTVHFASLVPYAAELFSRDGVIADATALPTYGVFPNLLAVFDGPGVAMGVCIFAAASSLALALGYQRRIVSLVLWYLWACLLHRNPFIANPSIPYVGWLLLACAVIGPGESLRPNTTRWSMPAIVYVGGLALLALGYTASGLHKLGAPSWRDGTALLHVLNSPLARPGPLRDTLVDLGPGWLAALTYGVLALEILAGPAIAWRRTRPLAWTLLLGMHVGIVLVLDFADLTLGMTMIHLFTFDPRWFARPCIDARPALSSTPCASFPSRP